MNPLLTGVICCIQIKLVFGRRCCSGKSLQNATDQTLAQKRPPKSTHRFQLAAEDCNFECFYLVTHHNNRKVTDLKSVLNPRYCRSMPSPKMFFLSLSSFHSVLCIRSNPSHSWTVTKRGRKVLRKSLSAAQRLVESRFTVLLRVMLYSAHRVRVSALLLSDTPSPTWFNVTWKK